MEFISDCESVRTEDFATKFCEYVTADNCKDSGFSCGRSEQCVTPTPRDDKFSDFSSQKTENHELKNESRMSPRKQVFTQKLNLNSVKTEILDDQQQMSDRSVPTDSSSASLHLGNLANVQPIRRDIMNKFLSKHALGEMKLSTETQYHSTDHQRANGQLGDHNDKRSSSTNEVNWKNEYNRILNSPYCSTKDFANDIRKKSIRIQNEIHEERKRKVESTQEIRVLREETPRERLDMKVKELDQLTDIMRKARADREKLSEEFDNLRGHLKHKSAEQQFKPNVNSSTTTPDSHKIVVNNLQIRTSPTPLDRLNSQLNEKKLYLKDLEDRIRHRLFEIQDLESIGLSKEEIQRVIEERNELYEILHLSEENENNRYELEKRLRDAKEELSLEHKRSQEKTINLEDELDDAFKKISGSREEKDRMAKELHHYKETIKQQQDNINELYIERNELRRQMDKYKEEIDTERGSSREMLQQERRRYECHLATEEAQTKLIIADFKNQQLAMQTENKSAVEKGLVLKSKISQLENECLKLRNDLELRENEFRERTEKIVDEKNQTIERFRKEFYSKKENEIHSLKIELDSEQMRTIHSLKECYKQQNADLQIRLENKSQEVQDLKSDIRRTKQDFSEKENNIKSHFESEISKLKEEGKKHCDNLEIQKFTDIEEYKIKYEALLKKINKEMEEERRMNERLTVSLEKANKDLIQQSELAKKYKNEKTIVINKLKDNAREKLQKECENLKEFYQKELEDQLKIVEQTMQEKNCQVVTKSTEIISLQIENKEIKNAFIRHMTVFFDEIQSQCSEMANDGKFVPPSFKNLKFTDGIDVPEVVKSILKNFQICCQEYSRYYHEIFEKMKEEKDQLMKSMEEKHSRSNQATKEQILKDHAEELNTLNTNHKKELNAFQRTHHEEIECLRRNVKQWKEKTATRLAEKLHKEFHKELEKKSNRHDMNKTSSRSLQSFKEDISYSSMKPIGLIGDLRTNIKQLRGENLSMRKVILGNRMSPNDEWQRSDYSGTNGLTSTSTLSTRPQSVAHDSYRPRPTDVHMARSRSYKISK